jgi:hypothetical protein
MHIQSPIIFLLLTSLGVCQQGPPARPGLGPGPDGDCADVRRVCIAAAQNFRDCTGRDRALVESCLCSPDVYRAVQDCVAERQDCRVGDLPDVSPPVPYSCSDGVIATGAGGGGGTIGGGIPSATPVSIPLADSRGLVANSNANELSSFFGSYWVIGSRAFRSLLARQF